MAFAISEVVCPTLRPKVFPASAVFKKRGARQLDIGHIDLCIITFYCLYGDGNIFALVTVLCDDWFLLFCFFGELFRLFRSLRHSRVFRYPRFTRRLQHDQIPGQDKGAKEGKTAYPVNSIPNINGQKFFCFFFLSFYRLPRNTQSFCKIKLMKNRQVSTISFARTDGICKNVRIVVNTALAAIWQINKTP